MGPVTYAVGNCALRFADREVKAASRAQRGRSNAERLERATRDRTIEPDGRWKQDADSPRGAGLSSAMPHSPARLRQRPPWRERPLPWPRARSQTRSNLVVAHATFLRLSASSTDGSSAGGKNRRPLAILDNSHSLFQLLEWSEGSMPRTEPGAAETRHEASRGNTSRGGAFPPWFP